MIRRPATAKVNLALAVGARGADGKHEVTTVFQRLDLSDRIALERAPRLRVDGFAGDTLVRSALVALAEATGSPPAWRVTIEKRIPVASGLGGGSSDAATALRMANETLPRPLDERGLHALATTLGSDVPSFLTAGPQLGEGDGSVLRALDLPQDYWVVLVLPRGARKLSTRAVYDAFDLRDGQVGYAERQARVLAALEGVEEAGGLAALPSNDLVSSPVLADMRAAGAFRADVSGAGPTVYGLFHQRRLALAAGRALRRAGRTWLTLPAWYG